nr:glycosyltransferase [Micromonospora sp. DSM 115978]
MKWLVVQPGPNFSVADVYTGWCEALRDAGERVSRYNLDERLTLYGSVLVETDEPGQFRRAFDAPAAITRAVDGLYSHLYRWQPDVLLVVSGFFIPIDLIDLARRRGTRVVLLCTEQPYELQRELALAAHTDLTLLNDPTYIERFREVTAAEYMPHAYRPMVHCPGPPVYDSRYDLSFVGTGYPSRIAFLERMLAAAGPRPRLDVMLAGNWQALPNESPLCGLVGHDREMCLDNADAVEVYRSTRVGINLYRREAEAEHLADGWAMGPREVEMAACNLFFLRESRPEGDELLPMLPTVDSPEHAAERLRWWLAHPDAREAAARAAREAVADRTFDNHAARLLGWLTRRDSG